jgi:hypothetical protein
MTSPSGIDDATGIDTATRRLDRICVHAYLGV